jgi:hypothetical protein
VVTDAVWDSASAGFLELEEIDGADFGIFGSAVEDAGASERKVGNNDQKKTKRGKRKRGDAAKLTHGDLVAEGKEDEGEKAGKKGNRKRKKRKAKDSESKDDAADDNVEDGKSDATDNVEEGKKGKKKGKKKRIRKKRKLNAEEKDVESKEDVTDDDDTEGA